MEHYQFDMTAEQAKLARWAGRTATKHLAGIKLYEGIKIGEALLIGRAQAMRSSHAQTLRHKGYALAFQQWKKKYGFPDEKTNAAAKRFYSDAIVLAEHREFAETLVNAMPATQKAEMGVFGLAKLIQMNLKRRQRAAYKGYEWKPSFGPWMSKREMELREEIDVLTAQLEHIDIHIEMRTENIVGLRANVFDMVAANLQLLKATAPFLSLCQLDDPARAKLDRAIAAWRRSWERDETPLLPTS
jgi:hypothetical protein